MEHILGKVTAHGDEQGGPDVLLDLVVEREWLREAKTIDIELPRHLCCASCQGAGCSICGQSGALTLRGRAELGEIVRVTLPQQDPDSLSPPESTRVLMLNVPGHGGLPDPHSERASRGRLLIRITTNGPISSCVRAVAAARDIETEQVPSVVLAASTPVAAPRVQVSASPEQVPATPWTDGSRSQAADSCLVNTTRSVLPLAAAQVPGRAKQRPATKPSAPRIMVEPSIGWTWKDTLIGLLVLILGALAAWVFISPD